MQRRGPVRMAVVLVSLCASLPTQAALVTLTGANFDLIYDDALLGLFGAPTLAGDTFFFTPNNFRAESLNGAGLVTTNSTVSGLTLVAKNGYQFGSFKLSEFGDYLLNGAGSLVTVSGQLRAFNVANPLGTQTTANIAVDPSTPLNLLDGLNHDWLAAAMITNATPAVGGGVNVIASGASRVGLTLENRLGAFTQPGGTGIQQAFIEKKFAGTGITVEVSPVPIPGAFGLLAMGLFGLGAAARKRSAGRGTPASFRRLSPSPWGVHRR